MCTHSNCRNTGFTDVKAAPFEEKIAIFDNYVEYFDNNIIVIF